MIQGLILNLFTSENVHTFTHDQRLYWIKIFFDCHTEFSEIIKKTSFVTFSLPYSPLEHKYFPKGSNFHHLLCRKGFFVKPKKLQFTT